MDPPYNTGKEFVYSDDYKDNLDNYLKITGQKSDSEKNIKLTTNTEIQGRYHSNWLNMMYPRLKLARNLLTEQGVLFMSINDSEIENLKKLANDIFGEENVEIMIWEKVTGSENAGSGKMKVTKRFRKDHEYIIVCYKSKENTLFNKPLRIKKTKNEYGNTDNDPRGNWMSCEICKSENKSNPNGKNYFEVTTPAGMKISRQWHYSYDELMELDNDNRIYWGNGKIIPRLKKFLNEPSPTTPTSVIMGMYTQTEGNNDLKELNLNFDNPKPVNLIKWFLEFFDDDECIVLDFFSGSATTAQSTMELNSTDNHHRKFIMVQIPEATDEKSDAFKAGYKNICEIGKERIRRAGDKIIEESNNKNLDIGFKVFKLDSSNLEKWDPNFNNIQQSLLIDQIKNDRTNDDLIYEIILEYGKDGIDLTSPIEKHDNIYSIDSGTLIICLDDNITTEITDSILEISKNPSDSKVVFKDSGFATDSDKANIKEILKTNNIDEFITIYEIKYET
ncbi:MAG: site-specific DNA-methyltransferase [Methanobrevibacter sp.]|uniref:site-specific DNA-methyltransferase n=1 Tax=Methanobrevibacter sp. TaxID=66852 RepID=UPI003F062336